MTMLKIETIHFSNSVVRTNIRIHLEALKHQDVDFCRHQEYPPADLITG
jgi:hypothetical protein